MYVTTTSGFRVNESDNDGWTNRWMGLKWRTAGRGGAPTRKRKTERRKRKTRVCLGRSTGRSGRTATLTSGTQRENAGRRLVTGAFSWTGSRVLRYTFRAHAFVNFKSSHERRRFTRSTAVLVWHKPALSRTNAVPGSGHAWVIEVMDVDEFGARFTRYFLWRANDWENILWSLSLQSNVPSKQSPEKSKVYGLDIDICGYVAANYLGNKVDAWECAQLLQLS